MLCEVQINDDVANLSAAPTVTVNFAGGWAESRTEEAGIANHWSEERTIDPAKRGTAWSHR